MAIHIHMDELGQKANILSKISGELLTPLFFTDDKIIKIPLRLGRVLVKSMKYNIFPRETIIPPYTFSGELRECQKQVVDECKKMLDDFDGIILELHPGFGKTILSVLLASLKYKPQEGLESVQEITMIVVTRRVLLDQWSNTIDNFTDATTIGLDEAYWIVENGRTNVPVIILCMDTEILKAPQKTLDCVGTLIIDEAHCFCTPKRTESILAIQANRVICCTATPTRTDMEHKILYALCGRNIVSRSNNNKFIIYVIKTGVEIPIVTTRFGKADWNKIVAEVVASETRNKLICDMVDKFRDRKILVLARTVAHVEILAKMVGERGHVCDTMCSTKKTYNDSNVLIGTISKIGTGFDESTFCHDFAGKKLDTLIFALGVKDVQLLKQCKGRVDRSGSPMIIEMEDENSILKKHLRIRMKWYKENFGNIVRM